MTPGQKAYNAYADALSCLVPLWSQLHTEDQDAWARAAEAVREDCYEPGECIGGPCHECGADVEFELIEK